MKNKLHNLITFSVLVTILMVSLATQVRSTGIATGSYYLDTPLPIADYYIGQYSNNTYFALNGTNWQNFLRSDNASYVYEMVFGNCTDGDKVIAGKANFTLATPIYVPSNTHLQGLGWGVTIFTLNETNNLVGSSSARGMIVNENYRSLSLTQDSNIIISDLEVDGQGLHYDPLKRVVGIDLWGVRGAIIERIYAHDWSWAGARLRSSFSASTSAQTNSSTIRNSYAEDNPNVGFLLDGEARGDIYQCSIVDSFSTNADNGIALVFTTESEIAGNTLWFNNNTDLYNNHADIVDHYGRRNVFSDNIADGGNGITNIGISLIHHATHGDSLYHTISGNSVFGHRSFDIADPKFSTVSGNTVTVNSSATTPQGIAGASMAHNTIIGNTIVVVSGRGISLTEAGSDYNLITGNYLYGVPPTKSGQGVRIMSGANNNDVFGNYFYNMTTGTILTATASNNFVRNNHYEDCTTAISDSGTSTVIEWNEGYVTENSGLQTVASGETISHGLASTPIYASLVCLNTTYDSVPIAMSYNWTATGASTLEVYVYWTNGTEITDDIILVAWEARTWN